MTRLASEPVLLTRPDMTGLTRMHASGMHGLHGMLAHCKRHVQQAAGREGTRGQICNGAPPVPCVCIVVPVWCG